MIDRYSMKRALPWLLCKGLILDEHEETSVFVWKMNKG